MAACAVVEHFPIEILELLFDHLDSVSRQTVRLVCRHWSRVLWSDKYIRNKVLLVNPETLVDGRILQQMKRPFREIHITTGAIPSDGWKTVYYNRVKDLITSSVITENVKVIKIDANVKVLNYLFYNPVKIATYKQIEEFAFLTRVENLCSGLVNVNASFPRLTVLKLDSLSRGSTRLIRLFAKQITKLVIRVAYRRQLLAILAIRNLGKLRELAIGTIVHSRSDSEFLSNDDFNTQHLTLLRRLQRLEINDAANIFVFTYHFILAEMRNLTYLKITGVEMFPNVLIVVNQLVNLEFLQLLARSRSQNLIPLVRFNHPNLRTLHLAPQLMACAGHLPRLRTLAVINHTSENVSWHRFAGPGALQSFTTVRTLRKLHIRGIYYSYNNLHAMMHFSRSCKILLEDSDGFEIGTLHVRGSTNLDKLRCQYRGEIDNLTIRTPTVTDIESGHDISEFMRLHNGGCLAQFEVRIMERLEKFGKRIMGDFKSCKRAIQRNNLYNYKKFGCDCDCYYFGLR